MIMRDMFEMYYTLGLYNGLTEEDAHSYATEMVELFKQKWEQMNWIELPVLFIPFLIILWAWIIT